MRPPQKLRQHLPAETNIFQPKHGRFQKLPLLSNRRQPDRRAGLFHIFLCLCRDVFGKQFLRTRFCYTHPRQVRAVANLRHGTAIRCDYLPRGFRISEIKTDKRFLIALCRSHVARSRRHLLAAVEII